MNTTLSDLAHLLEKNNILVAYHGDKDAVIGVNGASCDSRCVSQDDIFICKGLAFKPEFLDSAIENGANSFLCDIELSSTLSAKHPNISHLVVSDLRLAMALVSPVAFGNPDKDVAVIGITGTKGKSTVSYMLKEIIDTHQPQHDASLIGSIETYDGIERFGSHNTTPEPPDLQRHIANARKSGHSPLIMEVSSQGLKYDRVRDLNIDIACFLNIGLDHISDNEHADFEDYFSSKLKIFDLCHKAVVNIDSDHADRILHAAHESQKCTEVIKISAKDSNADFWAEDICSSEGTLSFKAHTPQGTVDIEIPMLGIFNVENALCAIAMAQTYGCTLTEIAQGLLQTHVPGRMEFLKTEDPHIKAIVDFAHNRLSFQAFFNSITREFERYKVISVFGSVGGKAKDRRYDLPQVAQEFSDHIIFTEDDPIYESVEDICEEMASNITNGTSHEIIPDRIEAIHKAVELAKESNQPTVICLLAKGDDAWMHRGDRFDPAPTDSEIFKQAVHDVLRGE